MSQTGAIIKSEVNDHDWDLYKLVSEHFRQDLREFWSRSSLYILSQAFLFAAFATLVGQSRVVGNQVFPPHLHDVIFEVTLGCIGALLALIGWIVAWASAQWIYKWRDQIEELDAVIDRYHCFISVEGPGEKGIKGKVMRVLQNPIGLTQRVPFVYFLGWIVMTGVVILDAVNPQVFG